MKLTDRELELLILSVLDRVELDVGDDQRRELWDLGARLQSMKSRRRAKARAAGH